MRLDRGRRRELLERAQRALDRVGVGGIRDRRRSGSRPACPAPLRAREHRGRAVGGLELERRHARRARARRSRARPPRPRPSSRRRGSRRTTRTRRARARRRRARAFRADSRQVRRRHQFTTPSRRIASGSAKSARKRKSANCSSVMFTVRHARALAVDRRELLRAGEPARRVQEQVAVVELRHVAVAHEVGVADDDQPRAALLALRRAPLARDRDRERSGLVDAGSSPTGFDASSARGVGLAPALVAGRRQLRPASRPQPGALRTGRASRNTVGLPASFSVIGCAP